MARLLREDETAVLKAIFDQRKKHMWSSIFEYDFVKAQEYLDGVENGPGKERHYEIINALTDEGIIETDCLIDTMFIKNYRDAAESKLPLDESNERYRLLRGKEWAREYLKPNKLFTKEEIGAKYSGSILINMTDDDKRRIERDYIANRIVQLTLAIDGDECILRIKFGEEDWRDIYRMKKNKTTAKILYIAYKHADREIKTKHKYLEGRIFINNGPVKALNPTLIKLDGNKITFRTRASVTPAEFERLKKALKIA